MADIASWAGALDPWQIWLLAALLILIIDLAILGGLMSGGGGITLVLAGGALGAMVAAAFGAELAGQLSAGVVGMILAGALAFWVGRRWAGRPQQGPPDDPRVRNEILHLEPYNGGLGVRVLGDAYPARPEDPQQTLQEGDAVRIQRFQGITAVVRPAGDDPGTHSSHTNEGNPA
ncbi:MULTISPECIES: NfeD family protein [unclassified Thioalkalivibrio]|uniref:NfeD family protein n=1 Tax=unclassified Thioalkalivibrio TaxID=2621013 RepID=UPI0003604A0A|nr:MULTISPECIES: NfeD family protein [unclassified Thioalkalivibrio]